jgi:hypothetical protein
MLAAPFANAELCNHFNGNAAVWKSGPAPASLIGGRGNRKKRGCSSFSRGGTMRQLRPQVGTRVTTIRRIPPMGP